MAFAVGGRLGWALVEEVQMPRHPHRLKALGGPELGDGAWVYVYSIIVEVRPSLFLFFG